MRGMIVAVAGEFAAVDDACVEERGGLCRCHAPEAARESTVLQGGMKNLFLRRGNGRFICAGNRRVDDAGYENTATLIQARRGRHRR